MASILGALPPFGVAVRALAKYQFAPHCIVVPVGAGLAVRGSDGRVAHFLEGAGPVAGAAGSTQAAEDSDVAPH